MEQLLSRLCYRLNILQIHFKYRCAIYFWHSLELPAKDKDHPRQPWPHRVFTGETHTSAKLGWIEHI